MKKAEPSELAQLFVIILCAILVVGTMAGINAAFNFFNPPPCAATYPGDLPEFFCKD